MTLCQNILSPPLIVIPAAENFAQSSNSVPSSSVNLFFLRGNDPRLLNTCQQIEIAQMITDHSLKTSTYVYNSAEAKRKYRNWVKTFSWIKPHYAIKSNPSLPLLQDLIKEGSNFDCASKTELEVLLNLGVDASKLVYSNPIKEESDLQWTEKNHVQLTTADTIEELIKIKKYAPNMQILWRISIKEEASDNLSTPFSGKFGDDIETPEKIIARMKEIQQMGIKLKGIHFHCGSGQHGSSAFERAILNARQCLEIGRQYGHEMKIMDIGGGFPAGEITKKTIDALKITQNDPLDYQVIAEPGRHFCANSFYVLTKVLGKRTKNGKPCYHLNESLYHTFNCVIMDDVNLEGKSQFYSKIDSKTLEQNQIDERQISTLFGMTCDGMDVIAKNAFVPVELKVGDWLCVSGMGAYTFGSRTEFNGMKSLQKIIRWSVRVDENCIDLIPAEAL